jgi:peptidoglycan hydrolase-like protein with peptidoglycan-binding domain
VFDERTTGALKAFQRHSGLKPTGVVDPNTWKRLKTSFILSSHAASAAQAIGERSAEVRRTEALLKEAGFNPGKVDGLSDKRTFAAVRAIEKRTRRERDGEVNAGDLKALTKLANTNKGIEVTNEMCAWSPVDHDGGGAERRAEVDA